MPPPIAWSSSPPNKGMAIDATYTFTGADGGTRLVVATELRPKGFLSALSPLLRLFMRREVARKYATFKGAVEIQPDATFRWLGHAPPCRCWPSRGLRVNQDEHATPSIGQSIVDAAGTPHVPVTFDRCDHVDGPFLHGTTAAFEVGDKVVAGHPSNYHAERRSNHLYFAAPLEPAIWGAELAAALTGSGSPGAAPDARHHRPAPRPGAGRDRGLARRPALSRAVTACASLVPGRSR